MSASFSRKLVLAVSFAAAMCVLGCKKESKKDSPDDSKPPPFNAGQGSGGPKGKSSDSNDPPTGWCEARDTVGGYRIFMPGDKPVAPDLSKAGGKEYMPTGCYAAVPNPNIHAQVRTFSLLPPAGVTLGTTPDQLFAGLQSFNRGIDQLSDVLEKAPVTIGGKPALKVVLKAKPSNRPKMDAGSNPVLAKIEAEAAEREQKEQAKRQVYYITNTGSRIVIIQVDTPGEPDPTILKTVTDSFAFL